MKTAIITLLVALSAPGLVVAQSSDMKSMASHGAMDTHKCMDMQNMKGMEMKGMDAEKCKAMMNAKGGKHASNDAKVITHKAVGVVQKIDRNNGTVTLAHEAVQSLNWPAMTMAFAVKPKGLLDKFAVGKKVNVEFVEQGKDYVVTAVK
ncbi:MAG: copper-binding protein [Massilia sp.]|nr:copper-binding protein [Massilia sp.]